MSKYETLSSVARTKRKVEKATEATYEALITSFVRALEIELVTDTGVYAVSPRDEHEVIDGFYRPRSEWPQACRSAEKGMRFETEYEPLTVRSVIVLALDLQSDGSFGEVVTVLASVQSFAGMADPLLALTWGEQRDRDSDTTKLARTFLDWVLAKLRADIDALPHR